MKGKFVSKKVCQNYGSESLDTSEHGEGVNHEKNDELKDFDSEINTTNDNSEFLDMIGHSKEVNHENNGELIKDFDSEVNTKNDNSESLDIVEHAFESPEKANYFNGGLNIPTESWDMIEYDELICGFKSGININPQYLDIIEDTLEYFERKDDVDGPLEKIDHLGNSYYE
ncbi:1075_t:CDS:2 [Entrophospora sp. SA101]|nr:1075_t:CDS:2 [Entrophospora sp. SA101]